MSWRIEWRTNVAAEDDRLSDVLLAIEEGTNRVTRAWPVDLERLRDFLNDMDGARTGGDGGIEVDRLDPAEWGDLVIARSAAGDVLRVDPQLYWEGVQAWFRSRGSDPHLWRGRR